MAPDPLDRCAGALLGLACGDAVGTTVEFRPRGSFAPVTDMVGGGPFRLLPGQWTDDTSMALCLADSLLARGRFDARDQMERYVGWCYRGERSVNGRCFDIGHTTRAALERFGADGNPMAGDTSPRSAGNGSLMRLAPIVLFAHPDGTRAVELAAASSRTTHGAAEAVDACRLLAWVLHRALEGQPRHRLLEGALEVVREPKVVKLARGAWRSKPESKIRGSGYAVESLEAALWAFEQSEDFASAVLTAVNLGDDADTTGAITGQIAGAYYGLSGIPDHWRERVWWGQEIAALGAHLGAMQERPESAPAAGAPC